MGLQSNINNKSTNLFGQVDGGVMTGDTGDPVVEVLTAGSQDRPVRSETGIPHLDCQITKGVLLPLLIQTLEKVDAVHCRLKGKHWRAEETQHRAFSERNTSIAWKYDSPI